MILLEHLLLRQRVEHHLTHLLHCPHGSGWVPRTQGIPISPLGYSSPNGKRGWDAAPST